VDPALLSQLTMVITGLANGALGEAGKDAWDGLAGLVRKLGHRNADVALPAEADRAAGTVDVAALAQALALAADRNPEFATALSGWQAETAGRLRDVGIDQGTTNVISGTVHGPAVQARDIRGNISFGGSGSDQ
jgi:hypothetical protein